MGKQEVTRGTRKRFDTNITDPDGNAQDPDSCTVKLIKNGEYSYDSPKGPYTCAQLGTRGSWGASIWLHETMTLGDWVARFEWMVAGIPDGEEYLFVVVDKVRPYLNKKNVAPNVQIVG